MDECKTQLSDLFEQIPTVNSSTTPRHSCRLHIVQTPVANTTQRTPEETAKKNAAPTGVRMRHRQARRLAKTEMDGAWEIPRSWRLPATPTAIHAHCLLLYFFSQSACGASWWRLHPAAVFNNTVTTCYGSCGWLHLPSPTNMKGKPAHGHVESGG